MSSNNNNESPQTYKARQKIKDIFKPKHYIIEEEVRLESVTNNIGEEFPAEYKYKADMLLTKSFIIELDSKKLHGTHRRIVHDQWRDKNIRNQINLKTVRLISKDVLKQSEADIINEIEDQLNNNKDPQ